MPTPPPETDPADDQPTVGPPAQAAGGIPAVTHALAHGLAQLGPVRTARTLLRVNQKHGFDCPGCAWPEPEHRQLAEFCENGAKAVAEEATLRRVDAAFFAAHPVAELATRSDHWLGQQGRLTEPMVLHPGASHYQPLGWEAALDLVAAELRATAADRAVFYTSGRTSNEAAFLYQLLVRAHGTNNLPDCSNMCHESSGTALTQTLGVGKGSVSLADLYAADLILVVGQNPGTNHPRMLTALERAKKAGARIVSVNPLPEAGLGRFDNPQHLRGLLGRGTQLTDLFLQVRLGGDLALFKALGHLLLATDQVGAPALDHEFIARYTDGFEAYASDAAALDWDQVLTATGLRREEIEQLHQEVLASRSVVVCWAMGLTQHRHAVATIREVVNLLLLRGNVGRPGAGVCPVRGHSNVQGDRTMGIWEKPPAWFLDALAAEFGIEPPRAHGLDTVESIRAMLAGEVDVFFAMGGNFVRAAPDSARTEQALRATRLTVQVSTKLNRSHTVTGRTALILPVLGRTERDVRAGGEQFVTVEDSMGLVHASRGRLAPAAPDLPSEVALVCRLAARVLAGRPGAGLDWSGFEADYGRVRDRIARVVPGFADFNTKVSCPGGFALPHPVRDSRTFPTATGKARFTVNELTVLRVEPGQLLLQTLRSHDQYNTTVYGLDDRYRGIRGGRRVVLVNPADAAALGFADGDRVDLVDASGTRRVRGFWLVAYPTALGCAAAYFPEANALVALEDTAEGSNTPASKSVVVRLEPAGPGAA